MFTYTEQQQPLPRVQGQEEGRVTRWRFEQFSALGFEGLDALLLAVSDADLNTGRAVMGGGCSPSLALKILL
jgi:hypothetical protein